MQYTHYDSSRTDSMFPAGDRNQQLPHPLRVDHTQDYPIIDGSSVGCNFETTDDMQGFHAYGIASVEDCDAARGPRLTQEQLVYLEREFNQSYKPNTEYKRLLAERMHVDFAKVNNWFQNRRAKAKHESQAQQRSDRSIQEPTSPVVSALMDYNGIPESHSSGYYSSPEQAPFTSGDLVPSMDSGSVDELPPHYYAPNPRTTFPIDQSYETTIDVQPNYTESITMQPHTQWLNDSYYSDLKVAPPSVLEVDTLGLLSEPQSIQSYSPHMAQGNLDFQNPPMYHDFVGGHLISNTSSQSLGTSSSEEGEPTNLFTPPQEISPHPGHNQGVFQHDRQASNSSDLADNLDTIHLQQSQSGASASASNANISISNAPPATGLPTPEVSPDTISAKSPFAPTHDLASRRKRPRPAALQPESSRSLSCAGPLATSPLLRISPPPSGKLSPIRRIQSTGVNSNVMVGRVKKASTVTSQLSPRNLESCFQLAAKPEPRPSSRARAHCRQIPDANGNLFSDSPAVVPTGNYPGGTLPDISSQFHLSNSTWDQLAHENVPYAYQNGFSWGPSRPEIRSTDMPHPPHQSFYPQHYPHSCPPQSAPPHITTFDTATTMLESSGGPWYIPPSTPAPYRDDTRLSMPIRQNHLQADGSLNYYQAAGPNFQNCASGMGQFPSCIQFSHRPPTPPHKALDIKVDIGPSPPKEMVHTFQERKEYTFENSFAGDLLFRNGSKK